MGNRFPLKPVITGMPAATAVTGQGQAVNAINRVFDQARAQRVDLSRQI
ncbi:MAG: hypothetical protein PVG22_15785 [Chromatiales bacterium]|jgi:hypothetical protein